MELKPCPFCGKANWIELDYIEHTQKSRRREDALTRWRMCLTSGTGKRKYECLTQI